MTNNTKLLVSKLFSQLRESLNSGDARISEHIYLELSSLELTGAAQTLLRAFERQYFAEGHQCSGAVGGGLLSNYDSGVSKTGISIVSCCMNRNENLRKAIRSWLKLDVNEIVIVDWSSTVSVRDTLFDISDDRIKIIRVEGENNWILTYGFNVGLRFASYDRVYKLDADIEVTDSFLELNKFEEGEYIRGYWKEAMDHSREDQKYVNGSFGAFKSDLRKVGYYNEFIRSYGYDDSDLYRRLDLAGGLSSRYISYDSIHHLEQKEEERLQNQNVDKDLFLGAYAATELHNLANKYISQLYDYWFAESLQDYDLSLSSYNEYRAHRITEDVYIPDYVLQDATAYAVIQLLTWKFNSWVWSATDNKALAHQIYNAYQKKLRVDEIGSLFGLDSAYEVEFFSEVAPYDAVLKFDHSDEEYDRPILLVFSGIGDRTCIKFDGHIYTLVYLEQPHFEEAMRIRGEVLGSSCVASCSENQISEHSLAGQSLLGTSVYDEKEPHRMDEYLECFARNIEQFDILALYYEEEDGRFISRARDLLLSRYDSEGNIAKVFFINIESRPTFRFLFDKTDQLFPGSTVFISNADIAFDHTVTVVPRTIVDDVFLVLSRKEVIPVSHEDDGMIMNQFGLPNLFSADAWIYQSPLKFDFRADFHIGSFHCDSFLNYHIANSGYKLYNPCLSINCFHIHDPVFNSSQEKELTQSAAIQEKLQEETHISGGVVPIRGVQWCRYDDVFVDSYANQIKEWSDLIVNIEIKPDGSNLITALLQLIICLKVNSHIRGGKSIWLTLPLDVSHSNVGDILFRVCSLLEDSTVHVGVSNSGKEELFSQNLEEYERIAVSHHGLVDSYKKACCNLHGSIYESATEYYFYEGSFGINHNPALLCNLDSNANDIDVYCLLSALEKDDRANLTNLVASCIDFGFKQFLPFLHDLTYTGSNSAEFHAYSRFCDSQEEHELAPNITLITSIYRGDEFFRGYLENIAVAAVESNAEVIMLNAASPGNETAILNQFLTDYPALSTRFKYIELDEDPGLYNCWRIAIEDSRSHYISNANLDDRRSPYQLNGVMSVLDSHEELAGGATAIRATTCRNASWYSFSENDYWFTDIEESIFGFDSLYQQDSYGLIKSRNMMHCMPVWRRGLHDKYGYFDEEAYGTSADWAFWLECAKHDEQFVLLPSVSSLYFVNESSHNRINDAEGEKELRIIRDYLGIKQSKFLMQ